MDDFPVLTSVPGKGFPVKVHWASHETVWLLVELGRCKRHLIDLNAEESRCVQIPNPSSSRPSLLMGRLMTDRFLGLRIE